MVLISHSKTSTVEKDLAVWIDNKLSFSHHTSKSSSKANCLLGLICRTFKYLDKENLPLLYKTIVRPLIEYANSVWWPVTKGLRTELEKVQHRATKMVPELKNEPYEEQLRQSNLPSTAFRHLRGNMINVFKYASETYNHRFLRFQQVSSSRSNGFKLPKRQCKTTQYLNYFTNSIIDAWNNLPTDVVTAPSVNAFKNRLDKLWEHHLMPATSYHHHPRYADYL